MSEKNNLVNLISDYFKSTMEYVNSDEFKEKNIENQRLILNRIKEIKDEDNPELKRILENIKSNLKANSK